MLHITRFPFSVEKYKEPQEQKEHIVYTTGRVDKQRVHLVTVSEPNTTQSLVLAVLWGGRGS